MPHLGRVEASPQDVSHTPVVHGWGDKERASLVSVYPDRLLGPNRFRVRGWQDGDTPNTLEAPTLQACGGFLRGDVLHHFGAPKDDMEPGVCLKVQHPAGAEVFDGLLGRRGGW